MERQCGFCKYPDFKLVGGGGPMAACGIASRYEPGSYALRMIAAGPGLVRSSSGASMQARPFGRARGIDTLVIAGGDGSRSAASCAKTLRFIRHCAGHARRTTIVCSGSYLLAAAALLAPDSATTPPTRPPASSLH